MEATAHDAEGTFNNEQVRQVFNIFETGQIIEVDDTKVFDIIRLAAAITVSVRFLKRRIAEKSYSGTIRSVINICNSFKYVGIYVYHEETAQDLVGTLFLNLDL